MDSTCGLGPPSPREGSATVNQEVDKVTLRGPGGTAPGLQEPGQKQAWECLPFQHSPTFTFYGSKGGSLYKLHPLSKAHF